MAEIYGHRWTSNFGDSHNARVTWQKGLADRTPGQIAEGLRACLDRPDSWPPTLPEFRALCLPVTPEPAHAPFLALPRPPQDPETIRAALGSMRSLLGSGEG